MKKDLAEEITALVGQAKVAYVTSIDENGYPNTKAMFALQHDGPATHYFSTALSARRSRQFLKNPKACIYFCSETEFKGLMLVGRIEVLTDRAHKAMLWRDGFEIYYPDGIDTEDYCVLKFTAEKGNYYHGLADTDFEAEELAYAGV